MRLLAIAPTGFFADYGCHVRIRGQMAALQARGHTVRIVTYPGGRDVDGLATRARPSGRPAGRCRWDRRGASCCWTRCWPPPRCTPRCASPAAGPTSSTPICTRGRCWAPALARLLRAPLVFDFQGSLTAEMLDHRFLRPEFARAAPAADGWKRWIDRQPQAILASSQHAAGLLRRGRRAGRPHPHPARQRRSARLSPAGGAAPAAA